VVYLHVITKMWQLGSLVGVVAGSGVAMLRRSFALKSFGVLPIVCSATGVIMGVPATYFQLSRKPGAGGSEEDRSFRIQHNYYQNRIDKFSFVGAVVGAGVAMVGSTSGPILGNSLRGLVFGCVLGQLSYKVEEYVAPQRHKQGSVYPPWKL